MLKRGKGITMSFCSRRHRHNLGGGGQGGWQVPLHRFFYLKVVFLLLSGRGADKKEKYILNDYLNGVKKEGK